MEIKELHELVLKRKKMIEKIKTYTDKEEYEKQARIDELNEVLELIKE